MKIYVVDNSMMTCAWIAEIISDLEGLQIVGFTGKADEAINKFNELNPDVVILNYQLYGGTGIDVLKKIKQIRPDTTVVMLSNGESPESRESCMRLGADYFFNEAKDFRKILQIALSNKLYLEWYHMLLNN